MSCSLNSLRRIIQQSIIGLLRGILEVQTRARMSLISHAMSQRFFLFLAHAVPETASFVHSRSKPTLKLVKARAAETKRLDSR